MKEGEIILARLPAGPGRLGTIRPALVIREMPGYFPALLCGISSQIDRVLDDWDIVVDPSYPWAAESGLKVRSVVRPSWLMTVPVSADLPLLGRLSPEVLALVRSRLAHEFAGR